MALGVMVGALTLGSALPHLVNGLGGLDWQVVILATSLSAVTGGLIAEFVATDGPNPFPSAPFDPRQAGRAWRNQGVRLSSLGYFGHMWELYAMWAWFAAFFADTLADSGHADVRTGASLATFVVIGAGAVGCWVGGLLGDRWGRTSRPPSPWPSRGPARWRSDWCARARSPWCWWSRWCGGSGSWPTRPSSRPSSPRWPIRPTSGPR